VVDTEDARYRKEDTAGSEGMRYHMADRVVVEKYHAADTVYAGKCHVVGMGTYHVADTGMYHVVDTGMNRAVMNHVEGRECCHEEDCP
jgi:hypothetical protein